MKIILNGSNGRMGKEILSLIAENYAGAELAAAVDMTNTEGFKSLAEYSGEADCIVDFTHHTVTKELLDYATRRNLPLVIATTGQTEEELAMIRDAAKKIPIFLSANMAVGIAILCEIEKLVAKMMPDADIEIVETHHNRKVDAPSGTALMLANALKEVRPDANFVLGRSGFGKREKNDIGIHAIRVGNVVGEHEVIIGTDAQTITLKHTSHNRAVLGEGALRAAAFLVSKPCGMYNMNDLIKE